MRWDFGITCAAVIGAGCALAVLPSAIDAAQNTTTRNLAPLLLAAPIREWTVPTKDSTPYDVAIGPDGALWWSGQSSNRLGRLDVDTGIMREFPLPTENSGPRGLAFDSAGDLWYAASDAGVIGKLDPANGKAAQFPVPGGDQGRGEPIEVAVGRGRAVWFTLEAENRVGRLTAATGKIDLVSLPTENALPYGIVVTSAGVPIVSEFGTNKLTKIDPVTMAVTEYALPGEGTRPRTLAIASDDTVYFADYAEGHIGRFDPASGAAKLWPSPGGAESNPYGITVAADGMVWYSEAGVLPKNTLVRLDPKTGAFAEEVIPSGGGIVRGMAATRDGRIYFAGSALNTVGVVDGTRARARPAQ